MMIAEIPLREDTAHLTSMLPDPLHATEEIRVKEEGQGHQVAAPKETTSIPEDDIVEVAVDEEIVRTDQVETAVDHHTPHPPQRLLPNIEDHSS